MPDLRYQIIWRTRLDAQYSVSLVLDEEMVAKATKGGGVRETPSRLQLCQLVRQTASLRNPQLRLEPVVFQDLIIRQLS